MGHTHTEIHTEVHHSPTYWESSYKNNILQKAWYALRFKDIQKFLRRIPKKSKILDVGCGSGFSMMKSIPRGKNFEVHGVDITEDLINYAKKKLPHFNFKVAYGEELPYEDESFDTVMYLDVIEHLVKPVQSLQEAKRILKPGGLVYTMVVKEHHPMFRMVWWFWTRLKGKVWHEAHLFIYDEKLLKQHLHQAGLKLVTLNSIHFGMTLVAVAKKV